MAVEASAVNTIVFTGHNSQDHLEDLFPISTSNVAGGVDLNLTLRFPDHVALRTGREHAFSEISSPRE